MAPAEAAEEEAAEGGRWAKEDAAACAGGGCACCSWGRTVRSWDEDFRLVREAEAQDRCRPTAEEERDEEKCPPPMLPAFCVTARLLPPLVGRVCSGAWGGRAELGSRGHAVGVDRGIDPSVQPTDNRTFEGLRVDPTR